MINKFCSARLTFYTLLILTGLMAAGILMNRSFMSCFTALNEARVMEWLFHTPSVRLQVKIWFIVLCGISGLLLLNGLCCCFSRQLARARKSGGFRQWLFFSLHCLFILVLAGHGLILVTCQKQGAVTLFQGQKTEFNGMTITVDRVVFKDSPDLLKVSGKGQRAMMTREHIRLDHNYADLRFFQNGRPVKSGVIRMLSPLRHRFFQATLKSFVFREGQIGIDLIITRNLLTRLFFGAYGAMILVLALYTVITWQSISPASQKETSHELFIPS